jgi:hypothetical protein
MLTGLRVGYLGKANYVKANRRSTAVSAEERIVTIVKKV